MTVVNEYGVELDWDAATMLMDPDLLEMLHDELAPCTAQEFFTKYCEFHLARHGEEFELSKANPVW